MSSQKRGYSKTSSSIDLRLLGKRRSLQVLPKNYTHLPPLQQLPISGIELQVYINQLLKSYDLKIKEKDEENLKTQPKRKERLIPLRLPILQFNEDGGERIPESVLKTIDEKMKSYRPKCCSISKIVSQSAKQPDNPEVIKSARKAFQKQIRKYKLKIRPIQDGRPKEHHIKR